jgi:hypothetical protein
MYFPEAGGPGACLKCRYVRNEPYYIIIIIIIIIIVVIIIIQPTILLINWWGWYNLIDCQIVKGQCYS